MTTFVRVRRFGSWLTFLVMEAICLTMVVEYNEYQNRIFFHSANVFTGTIAESGDKMTRYLYLQKENDRLKKENAELRQRLLADPYPPPPDSTHRLIHRLPDSLREQFRFIPANVVNKTLLGQHNYFTLDRGSKDGVVENMGVISDEGIVGIVTNVSPYHAKVMTILHPQALISAAIKNNNYYGTLSWDGDDPRYMILDDIPKSAEFNRDDTIQTSGYTNIFPPEIVIGTIDTSYVKPGGASYTIRVKLVNDLNWLPYVYVVDNRMWGDMAKLAD